MTGPKTMLEWARFYADGWGACVIPLREGKLPAVKWAEFQRRRPTGEELEEWFRGDDPAWGMALVCGEVSGNLVRLDFDDPKDYVRLKNSLPPSAPVFRSQRKGGGYGILMTSPEPIPKIPGSTVKNYPKLEVMGEGSITVVPPTPGYEWVIAPEELPRVDFVIWLRDILAYDLSARRESGEDGGEPDDELDRLLTETEEGGRDDALVRLTNILRSRGLRLHAIKAVIRPHFDEWPGAGDTMTWEEASAKVEAAYYRYMHQGTRYARGDEDIGREFEDTEIDMADPVSKEAASKPFLVDRLVMGGDMANVAMAAYAGMGKTTITLGIAICMAQGRPIWGVLEVPRALKVVFIDQEEVIDHIRESANMMAEVFGKPGKGMLTLLSGKGDSYSIGRPESLRRLERRLDRIRPDFVFLDGWQWFVDNKISDRDVVGPALAWWKRIRSKYGCGTWIIHHTKKIGAPQYKPADPLELASGAQVLIDQARTKLVYEHLPGYEDFGLLQGRCSRATWNPIKIILEYDQTTQSHRMVLREQAEDIFDAETVTGIWGERERTRLIKGILNRLNRLNTSDKAIAEYLGISRAAVAKWRSGSNQPNAERQAQLEDLLAKLEGTPEAKRAAVSQQPVNIQSTKSPVELRQMPSPIGVPIKNELMNMSRDTGTSEDGRKTISRQASAEHAKKTPKPKTHEGKPGPLCGRCPLKDMPHVGGRGGAAGCVMLVGDSPGQTDAKSGKAYSGRTGLRLENALRKGAKLDPNLCRYTNAVRCPTPKSRAPTKKALECCRPLLEQEMAEFKPRMVITLGAEAFKAFYPGTLQAYHGLKLEGEGYTLIPMYKPSACDESPDILRAFTDDFYGLKHRSKVRRLEGNYRQVESYKPGSAMVAVDTETTGLALTSRLVGVSFCEVPGEAFYLPAESMAGFKAPETAIMHNAKYDLGIFESNGVPMSLFKNVEDTMLLAYVMCRMPLGLKDLMLQELNLEMRRFKEVLGEATSFVDVPDNEKTEYACGDADGTFRLWEDLSRKATSKELGVYRKLDKPLTPILAAMELRGVDVDTVYLEALGKEVDGEMDSVAASLEALHGLERQWLTSPKKMQDYIYRKLGLPISALTDPDNPSTGRRILEQIRSEHEAVDLILRYRELSTLKNSFVTGIIERSKDGRIHPQFNQARVVTGRLSSSDPNFQGIPSRRTSEFRKAIVAPPGYVIGAFDNSQIDLRALAYLSKCPVLNALYEEDADIHAMTSMLIYGDLEGTHRFEAKAANFMPVFGGTEYGLSRRTGMTLEQAKDFLDKWYAHYTGVLPWIRALRKQVLADGYVETAYGRRRYIPGVYTSKREHAFRQAQNTPIQGTSADIIKLQMIATAPLVLPFAQIHDELDFYLPEGEAAEMMPVLKAAMESVDCPFKLKVDAAMGPNLGELIKWEE